MTVEFIRNYLGDDYVYVNKQMTNIIIHFSEGVVKFYEHRFFVPQGNKRVQQIEVHYYDGRYRTINWVYWKGISVNDRFSNTENRAFEGEYIRHYDDVINIWQFIYPDAVYHILPYKFLCRAIRKNYRMSLQNLVLEILHIKKGE